MRPESYQTASGIAVARTISNISFNRGLQGLLRKLDTQRGIYLSSGYEFPGRYSRWDVAALAPPLEIVAAGRDLIFRALNPRGQILNRILEPVLAQHPHWETFALEEGVLRGKLKTAPAIFSEEERSKQPSAFSILRALIEEFRHPLASRLALVGAFGYDLLFQFDPIELKLPREGVKDLHLLLCDDIHFMDRKKEQIERYQFDFTLGELTTAGLPRSAERLKRPKASSVKSGADSAVNQSANRRVTSDHTSEEYAAKVEIVREGM